MCVFMRSSHATTNCWHVQVFLGNRMTGYLLEDCFCCQLDNRTLVKIEIFANCHSEAAVFLCGRIWDVESHQHSTLEEQLAWKNRAGSALSVKCIDFLLMTGFENRTFASYPLKGSTYPQKCEKSKQAFTEELLPEARNFEFERIQIADISQRPRSHVQCVVQCALV